MIPRTITAAERADQWPLGLEWWEWVYSRPTTVTKGRGPDRRKEVVYVKPDWTDVRFSLGLGVSSGVIFEMKVAAGVAFALTAGLWLRRFTEQLYEQKMIAEAIMQKEWNSLIRNAADTYAYKARKEGES